MAMPTTARGPPCPSERPDDSTTEDTEERERMTENGTWTEERVPASDVWGIEKSMGPMTPEEELQAWRTTSKVLDRLCGMADGLMLEPLILALADALDRAREEARRAEDRLSRPEGAEVGLPRPPQQGDRAQASLAPTGEERRMDEETRRERQLEALELGAAELEKRRMLREHEMGVRVVDEEGSLFVAPGEQ